MFHLWHLVSLFVVLDFFCWLRHFCAVVTTLQSMLMENLKRAVIKKHHPVKPQQLNMYLVQAGTVINRFFFLVNVCIHIIRVSW